MKISIVYGTMHKGSTYNCVKLLLSYIKDNDIELKEYFLPKDMPHFCSSCFSCFMNGEETCPHYKEMKPIVQALDDADLIILSSPSYVLSASGQMMAFLDHLAYRWIPHRPHQDMFHKTGLVISTAAGAGTKSTNKIMKKSLVYWGVKKVYTYGVNVGAMSWEDVNAKKKRKIETQLEKVAKKVCRTVKNSKKSSPSLIIKMMFYLMKKAQKNNTYNITDRNHWKNNGWLDGKKPW